MRDLLTLCLIAMDTPTVDIRPGQPFPVCRGCGGIAHWMVWAVDSGAREPRCSPCAGPRYVRMEAIAEVMGHV